MGVFQSFRCGPTYPDLPGEWTPHVLKSDNSKELINIRVIFSEFDHR